ncbi:MAG: hypothetical protein AAGB12_07830 [Pseudomonadota bacterium]
MKILTFFLLFCIGVLRCYAEDLQFYQLELESSSSENPENSDGILTINLNDNWYVFAPLTTISQFQNIDETQRLSNSFSPNFAEEPGEDILTFYRIQAVDLNTIKIINETFGEHILAMVADLNNSEGGEVKNQVEEFDEDALIMHLGNDEFQLILLEGVVPGIDLEDTAIVD